jgi:hypothetical protein
MVYGCCIIGIRHFIITEAQITSVAILFRTFFNGNVLRESAMSESKFTTCPASRVILKAAERMTSSGLFAIQIVTLSPLGGARLQHQEQ